MQPRVLRILLVVCVSVLSACVHDNPDARLDSDPSIDPRELAAMLKLDCTQRREEVLLARDDAQSDFDRIANYRLALKAFTVSAQRIEAAFTKEPDLLYLAEGDALRLRLQRCQAQARTFTDELRKFELTVEFKPAAQTADTRPQVAAVESAPEPVKRAMKPSKKLKKSKTAVAKAKRKKAGRPSAVLADASRSPVAALSRPRRR